MPGSWDIKQDYNCLQEHMVVKAGQRAQVVSIVIRSSGLHYSPVIQSMVDFSHWVIYGPASLDIVIKTLGAPACIDSATQFPNGDLLLFCLTSLSLHIPLQYLPPHHSSGTFWSSPEQMNKVFASSSGQETSAGGTLTFSPRTGTAPEQSLSARKHSWKPTWVQVKRKESTLTRYSS